MAAEPDRLWPTAIVRYKMEGYMDDLIIRNFIDSFMTIHDFTTFLKKRYRTEHFDV